MNHMALLGIQERSITIRTDASTIMSTVSLAQDPGSYVACETAAKTGMVMIFGGILTIAKINYESVVRNAIQIQRIGYEAAEKVIDYKTCNVIVAIEQPSTQTIIDNRIENDEKYQLFDEYLKLKENNNNTDEISPQYLVFLEKARKEKKK
eukprot:342393_1